ncbi:hypothetical protein GCM10027175_20620 [Hymenobacter latericoloratus]
MTWKAKASLLLVVTSGLCGAFFWKAGQTMDAGCWQPLAAAPHFYLRTDYEGRTTLGYACAWWQQPEPLAGGFYEFRRVGK